MKAGFTYYAKQYCCLFNLDLVYCVNHANCGLVNKNGYESHCLLYLAIQEEIRLCIPVSSLSPIKICIICFRYKMDNQKKGSFLFLSINLDVITTWTFMIKAL